MSAKNSITFSILMSVYNTKLELLEKCINSLIQQTFCDWELIILDNGSETSEQWDWLQLKVQEDNRIQTIRIDENVGWPKGSSICLSYAKGSYMTFLASDDTFVSSDCLDKINVEIQKNEPDIIWVGHLSSNYENGSYQILGGIIPQYKILSSSKMTEKIPVMNIIYYNSFFHYLKIDFLKEFKIDFYKPFFADCGGMTEALCRARNMVILDKAIYNLTYNTSQTQGHVFFDGHISFFSIPWTSVTNALEMEGSYDFSSLSFTAWRFFPNLKANITAICDNTPCINEFMQEIKKDDVERLKQVENILQDNSYIEIMFYYGRERYTFGLLDPIFQIVRKCHDNYKETNYLKEASNWLYPLILELYVIEDGSFKEKNSFTHDNLLNIKNALCHSQNKAMFGMELLLNRKFNISEDDIDIFNDIQKHFINWKIKYIYKLLVISVKMKSIGTTEISMNNIKEISMNILKEIETYISFQTFQNIKQDIVLCTSL